MGQARGGQRRSQEAINQLSHPFFVEFLKRYQKSRAMAQLAKERLHQNQSLKIVTVGEQMVTPKITLNPIGPGWSRASIERRMTEHNPMTQRVPYMVPRPLPPRRDHAMSVLGADFLPHRLSHLSRRGNDSTSASSRHAPSILITE
jgi:hypothetical protein